MHKPINPFMNKAKLKSELHRKCEELLQRKLDRLNQAFAETREALLSEAKSTAGDKHETGRAMIQLEQEKMSRQFKETEHLQDLLQRVPQGKEFSEVQSGALVQSSTALLYIAVGLGKVELQGIEVFVVAPSSPLAQLMLRMKAGESFNFNGRSQKVDWVY